MNDKDGFVKMTWEEWDEKYKPILDEDDYRRFETFDDDLATVQAADILKVWSVIEGGDNMYIQEGFHPVNLLYYLITKNPREESEDFNVLYYEEERKVCILELIKEGKEFANEYMKDKYGRWLYFDDYEDAERHLESIGATEEEMDNKYTLERVDIDEEMHDLLKVTVSVIVRNGKDAEDLARRMEDSPVAQEGIYTITCGEISSLTIDEVSEIRAQLTEEALEK